MAGLMEGALLPTIKCSNCGMSVEISEMGDHICKPAPGSCSTEMYQRMPALLTLSSISISAASIASTKIRLGDSLDTPEEPLWTQAGTTGASTAHRSIISE
jgi:hypothetical protein